MSVTREMDTPFSTYNGTDCRTREILGQFRRFGTTRTDYHLPEEGCATKDCHAQSALGTVEEIRDGTSVSFIGTDEARVRDRRGDQTAYPAFVRGELPAVPAKNLKIIRVQIFCDATTPPLKTVNNT